MLLDVKPRQPQGCRMIRFPTGPQSPLLGFSQRRRVMLLSLREFSLILIEPSEAHVGGVNLRVWLGTLKRLFQLFAKNEFGFLILLLLLVHLRQAMANKTQLRRIRGDAHL